MSKQPWLDPSSERTLHAVRHIAPPVVLALHSENVVSEMRVARTMVERERAPPAPVDVEHFVKRQPESVMDPKPEA
jgi:hypothetical protein